MAQMNTRSKTGAKKNKPITIQPGSTTKTSGVTLQVNSNLKTGSGGDKSESSGPGVQASAQEEVARLKAEKETALKERDRMEMKLQEKVEKVELEKDGLLILLKTTKERNTALEEELEKIKKEVLEAKGDKKVLESELRQLGEEVKLLQEEKDPSSKEFRELGSTIEGDDDKRGELYDKLEKVNQDRREAVDEANKLKEKVKCLQESLDKERAEKQQLVNKVQELEVKVKQLPRSSKDEEEDNEFKSFDSKDGPRASQQPLESAGKSVNTSQNKRSGSQENIANASTTCDDDPQKASEKELQEEIQRLKGQLDQAEVHRKAEFEIRKETEIEKRSLREDCEMLRRRIQEMEVEMSRRGSLIKELQTELKISGPVRLTEEDQSDPLLSSETTSTPPLSMGKTSKLEPPPSVRIQYLSNAAVCPPNQSPLGQNQSTLGQNQSPLDQNQSTLGQNQSTLDQNQSSLGQNQSTLGQNQSTLGQNQSTLGQNQSTLGQNQSNLNLGQAKLNFGLSTPNQSQSIPGQGLPLAVSGLPETKPAGDPFDTTPTAFFSGFNGNVGGEGLGGNQPQQGLGGSIFTLGGNTVANTGGMLMNNQSPTPNLLLGTGNQNPDNHPFLASIVPTQTQLGGFNFGGPTQDGNVFPVYFSTGPQSTTRGKIIKRAMRRKHM